jgi:glycosyltransferase involved in cell wall biosynthesis
MTDENKPLVSIILPVLNEAPHIEQCLRSMMNNTYNPNKVEVLVVDGGSTDGTRGIVSDIATQDQRVRLIDNPRRILAAGINIGIENARGEVLIRLDGHAQAERDFIERSVEVLQEHPDAWCVGGAITTVNNNYTGRVIAAAMSCGVGVGNAKFRLGNYEGYADTVAFGAYRKWVFEKVGKFDENLPRTEDDDLHFRLHQAGGKIYISHKIRSIYFSRSNIGKLWRQYFQYGFWRIPTIIKHGQPAAVRQVVPVVFVLGWLVLIAGALFWEPAKYALAAYAGLYIMVLLIGAILAIRKNGFVVGVATPIVFPILHFSYGLGNLAGIWRFVIRRGKGIGKISDWKITR